jgi:hypothetical protein
MNKSGDFMRRLDVNVLVWSLLLRVGSVAIAQTPAAHGCHDELFRAHDFTLGTVVVEGVDCGTLGRVNSLVIAFRLIDGFSGT